MKTSIRPWRPNDAQCALVTASSSPVRSIPGRWMRRSQLFLTSITRCILSGSSTTVQSLPAPFEKHSLYLISLSELPSFGQTEMSMVANVARYHRKAHPQPHHYAFTALATEEQERVAKLASILRIADSLDSEHKQRVTGVNVMVGEDEVSLWLDGTAGLLLKGWTLQKKAKFFAEVFGRKVAQRFLGEEQLIGTQGNFVNRLPNLEWAGQKVPAGQCGRPACRGGVTLPGGLSSTHPVGRRS